MGSVSVMVSAMKAAIKAVLKKEGNPVKFKKLASLVRDELGESAGDVSKNSVKETCEKMKKVKIDGVYASWSSDGNGLSETGECPKEESEPHEKRKARDEVPECIADTQKKRKKPKKEKKGKTEVETKDAEDDTKNEKDEVHTSGWNDWGTAKFD